MPQAARTRKKQRARFMGVRGMNMNDQRANILVRIGLHPIIAIIAIIISIFAVFIFGKIYVETNQLKYLMFFLLAIFVTNNRVFTLPKYSGEWIKENLLFKAVKIALPILTLISVVVVFAL